MLLPILATLLFTLTPADDEVLAEARTALEALDSSSSLVRRTVERAELEGRELIELFEAVSAPLPEAPATIDTYPDEGHDALAARFEAWRDHVALLEQRVDAPRRARERKAVQAELFAELEKAATSLTEAAEAAELALARVDPLVTEAKVTAEEAARALGLEELGQGATRVETARTFAATLPDRISALREAEEAAVADLSTVEPPPAELIHDTTAQRDASEILMSVITIEARERQTLIESEEAGIQAALDGAKTDWGAIAKLEELRSEARQSWEALQAHDRARAERVAPKREDFAEGDGHAELRAAHRELLWAEAMLAYRQETLALLESSRTMLISFREQLATGGDAIREAGGVLVRIRCAVQARAALEDPGGERPIQYEEVEGLNVWVTLKSIIYTEARRTLLKEEVERRLARTEPEQAERQALETQAELVERARAVLREEEAFATMVAEMAALEDGPLLTELDPDGAAFIALAEARAEEEARKLELAEMEDRLPEILERAVSLDAPYAQEQITAYPGRGEEIRQELAALEGRAEDLLPADTSELEERQQAITTLWDETDVEEVDEDEELLSPSKADLRALRLNQRAAKERLRYFLELEQLVGELREGIDEYQRRIDAVDEASAARLSLERRLTTAWREVERRRRDRVLPDARIPEDVVTALTREEVAELVDVRQGSHRRTDAVRELLRTSLRQQEHYLSWKQWAEIGGAVAQQNNNLIARPVAHVEAARTPVESLREFERENLEYTARQRVLDDRSTVMRLLASIAKPQRRERFEVTLLAYYLEVANLERVIDEYDSARIAYDELIEINQKYRTDLSGAIEAMQQVERERQFEYHVVRSLAATSANPSRRIRIAAEFSEALGRELPRVLDDHEWDRLYWADQLVEAEARLWGDRVWIATLTHRLSRHGIESDINAFRRHITHIGAEMDEVDGTRKQLLERIDELRSRYREDLWNHALWTLFKVALIPFLAILAVRGLRRVAGRMKRKAQGEVGSPDRQRRLETLTNVTTASIRVVVWLIAGIYVLAFLGLDITPIIASASVVGLAVAFGAQSLVRDFFAGFFMLLEHQYSVGDVVDLGVANGTVEHISLRMTTLRDLQGTVHYVPNGLVQRVANKTKGWSRIVLEVGVSYGEDVDRVTEILREVLSELHADEELGREILEEPSVAGVQALGESRIDLRVMVKTQPGAQWGLARELRRRIKHRFDAEGIPAPHQHRVIHQLGLGDRENAED